MPEGTMKALWYNKASLRAMRCDDDLLMLATITAQGFRHQGSAHSQD